MPLQRLVVANYRTGLETDKKPFLINDDAFPTLQNAYIWREQVARKRGTDLLGRLQRDLISQSLGSTDGSGNFTTAPGTIFSILGLDTDEPDASVVLGSITITIGADIFTEPSPPDGTLTGSTGGTGTINYSTGLLTITGAPASTAITITFGYYPDLPVMGAEDFDIGLVNQPLTISFDTVYSYGFNQGTNEFYDVNFYKSTGEPFVWTGQNYQQFYSTNYLGTNSIAVTNSNSGCLWVTNGNPCFHFITIANVTVANPGLANAVSTVTTTANHNLTNDDFVFINEVNGVTSAAPNGVFGGINGASGQVTRTGATTFTLPTPYATGAWISGGIVEYMTRNVTGSGDGIKWYDGDPTVSTDFGWVNFAPPLNRFDFVTNPNPFYLVGANIISPFKNRLIFSGVYLTNTAIYPTIQYFPNRIVYSQVGTPFYSEPLPFVIQDQAPDPAAWFQNQVGKGGFLTAPYNQDIVTVSPNEDVLIYGLETKKLRLVYTFDDTLPFIFQTINSEFGDQNTFSSVNLDNGVLGMANNAITLTAQTSCQRIDLQILDQIYDVAIEENKSFRVCAIRDYRNEWVYFTYCVADFQTKTFPSRTLLYNYRDNNWAIFEENFTHYGYFRRNTNRTWANIDDFYPTWDTWNDPWSFGGDEAWYTDVIGGNQQGFVLIKGKGTDEALSRFIQDIDINTFTITSPNHGLNSEDFIQVEGLIGITGINGLVFQVQVIDDNTFIYYPDPSVPPPAISGTYSGGGTFRIFSRPLVKTKQFPITWKDGHGSRVGTQRYLLETNDFPTEEQTLPQIIVQVYSSQNSATPSNDPLSNSYLVFSDIVLTCPEPNLYGANPSYANAQDQTWHRQSNSFNGDTVQFGFTLNDAQMYDLNVNTQEIKLYAIVLDLYPGPVLC